MRARIAAAAAAVVLLAGCGGPTDAAKVANTYTAFAQAEARGDADLACGLLSAEALVKLGGRRGCVADIKQVAAATSRTRRREVSKTKAYDVRVTGDRARFRAKGRHGSSTTRGVGVAVREHGAWRIEQAPPQTGARA